MKVLCLNTAFSQTYVAVENNSAIETKTMDSSLKQSENVLGVVDECLCRAKIDISDLNYIACVIGPGSFTGIRIGASLAKGAISAVKSRGILGIFTGGLEATAGGIAAAIIFAFIFALIFHPKTKKS